MYSILTLNREQAQAVGLLSIGTFLQYFDLMLYVHLTVILNEVFFPKTDPHTTALLSAFTFSSTFFFRPLGALMFGWVGDNIGRKTTVILTIMLTSVSCIFTATLPTYAQIGIKATWILTICRIIQGMSSMGEIVGAELYLTETIKGKIKYPIVALLEPISALGGTAALGVAYMVTAFGFNWNGAFWFGAIIAMVGSLARIKLRETPDFVDMKRRLQQDSEESNKENPEQSKDLIAATANSIDEKVNKKTAFSLFLLQCALPIYFYFAYVYCGQVLQNSFNYSLQQLVNHNFIVSIIDFLGLVFWALLSYRIYPLKILKTKLIVFSSFLLFCPYLLDHLTSPFHIFIIQAFVLVFALDSMPGIPIFYKYFPVLKRFTYATFIYALSRAVMFAITSFGLIYLVKYCGNWGLLIIMIPVTIGYAFGLAHFINLDQDKENNY